MIVVDYYVGVWRLALSTIQDTTESGQNAYREASDICERFSSMKVTASQANFAPTAFRIRIITLVVFRVLNSGPIVGRQATIMPTWTETRFQIDASVVDALAMSVKNSESSEITSRAPAYRMLPL